jgi:putative membrane protein
LIQAGLISNRGLLVIPVVLGLGSQLDLEQYIDVEQLSRYLPQDYTWQEATMWGAVGFAVLFVLLKLFSVGWYLWRFFGHRVERHGDDLRVSCGLFTRVSATVPRRRIQFISVQQTWLSRWVGLAVIRLETAGGAGKSAEDAKQSVARRWFMPVVAQHEVPRVLGELRAGLEFEPDKLDWRATSPATARRLTRLAVLRAVVLGGAVTGFFAGTRTTPRPQFAVPPSAAPSAATEIVPNLSEKSLIPCSWQSSTLAERGKVPPSTVFEKICRLPA